MNSNRFPGSTRSVDAALQERFAALSGTIPSVYGAA